MTKKYRRRKALTGVRTVFTVKNPGLTILRGAAADELRNSHGMNLRLQLRSAGHRLRFVKLDALRRGACTVGKLL